MNDNMQLCELIATLHHQIEKSREFIAATVGGDDECSKLHIAFDLVEIEVPVAIRHHVVEVAGEKVSDIETASNRLSVPFTPQEAPSSAKPIRGDVIMVDLVDHIDKIAQGTSRVLIGKVKIVFKTVIS